jgi:hypothetical protein
VTISRWKARHTPPLVRTMAIASSQPISCECHRRVACPEAGLIMSPGEAFFIVVVGKPMLGRVSLTSRSASTWVRFRCTIPAHVVSCPRCALCSRRGCALCVQFAWGLSAGLDQDYARVRQPGRTECSRAKSVSADLFGSLRARVGVIPPRRRFRRCGLASRQNWRATQRAAHPPSLSFCGCD